MIAFLNTLLPVEAFALGVILSAAVVCVCFALGIAWDSRPVRPPVVRQESPSERNHRIDAEARAAAKARDFDANLAARWQG